MIPYKAGSQTYHIHTPTCRKSIKRIARKTYNSMASAVAKSPTMSKSIINEIAANIKAEMKDISSDRHDSILRDPLEAVKHFDWDTVILELLHKMPTLLSLLSQIVRQPSQQKPLLCFLASQLIKSRHQRIRLVQ